MAPRSKASMAYWSYAVTNTMRVPGLASAAAAATSRPLRPGMRMSRNATCGRWAAISSSALAPSSHSATTWSAGQARRSWSSSACRSNASSSATTQVQGASVMGAASVSGRGHAQGGGHAVGEIGDHGQRGLAAEEQAQALAHVAQAHAGAAAGGIEALAVVGHRDRHLAIAAARADPDRAARGARLEAVLDRVLDQRLQHHRRERRGAELRGNVHLHLQPRPHADAQDLEVGQRALAGRAVPRATPRP